MRGLSVRRWRAIREFAACLGMMGVVFGSLAGLVVILGGDMTGRETLAIWAGIGIGFVIAKSFG